MPKFEQLGATVVAISPQLAEWSAKISKRHKLAFDVLSDAGNEVARRWGLVHGVEGQLREVYSGFGIDLPKYNGDDSWELPLPARVVIAADGTVASMHADPDYTRRPEPEATIAILESL